MRHLASMSFNTIALRRFDENEDKIVKVVFIFTP